MSACSSLDGRRRGVLVQQARLRLREVALGRRPDDDALAAPERPGDFDRIARLHFAMRFGRLAVEVHLAALDGALGLGPRLEEARDVEPDVEAEGVVPVFHRNKPTGARGRPRGVFGALDAWHHRACFCGKQVRPLTLTRMTRRLPLLILVILAAFTSGPLAQSAVTTPQAEFGHNFGDDYFLANYKQLSAYWQKLDRESDRMTLQSIGKTAEGREQLMAIVTSPENHRNLARYKDISRRLALAEGLTDDQARALAREGKAVVWIDGGLHATESLGAQQLGEMVYQMVSRTDDETMRILERRDHPVRARESRRQRSRRRLVHAEPGAHRAHRSRRLPRLYQKYIGHDNNRDFFASTQPETENMNRVLYREWFPQVLYNHHQSGPAGTVLWSPPLRDPFNYNQDPLLVLGIQTIGLAMHTRLAAENKPGATMRSGGPYDGWWNGGLRNTAAFHNTIAILTEMIGSPTPMRVPLVLDRQLPDERPHVSGAAAGVALPPVDRLLGRVQPRRARRRVADEGELPLQPLRDGAGTRSSAAAATRGRRSRIATPPRPRRLGGPPPAARRPAAGRARRRVGSLTRSGRRSASRRIAIRARYIMPSNQPDFPTATSSSTRCSRRASPCIARRARSRCRARPTRPARSSSLRAQAFRPHVIDMFEPQDHPDNFPYPGAPPTPPYDNAGWTLAFQMGVEFDRILEAFTPAVGRFEVVADWNLAPPPGAVVEPVVAPVAFAFGPAAARRVRRRHPVARGERGGLSRGADGQFVVIDKRDDEAAAEQDRR